LRDIAWAAGFYEGEGSCAFVNGSTRATIGQVNREPLDRIAALFGGHIFALKGHPAGVAKKYMGRPSWRWIAYGARARGILMTLYQMLSAKRQGQVRKALSEGVVKLQRWS
jgi:hypothetical protein